MRDESISCSIAAIVIVQIRRALVCLMQSADGILANACHGHNFISRSPVMQIKRKYCFTIGQ